jgi:uncharacterized protein
MKIVWDEPKRLANFDMHGFDFVDVIFFDWSNATIERVDPIGTVVSASKQLAGLKMAVVIYAKLGTEAISIISFRSASSRERKVLHGKT